MLRKEVHGGIPVNNNDNNNNSLCGITLEQAHMAANDINRSHHSDDDDDRLNDDNGNGFRLLPLSSSVPSDLLPLAMEPSSGAVDRQSAKVRHWREHEFAVGLVEMSWREELTRRRLGGEAEANGPNRALCADVTSDHMDPTCGCLYLSGIVCRNAGRVGNMVVLREHASTPPHNKRVLDVVVGPYWPMLVFVTYPLILGVSFWTLCTSLFQRHILVVAIWMLFTASLCVALFCVGCTDPGIFARHRDIPPLDAATRNSEWRWNDQALTYRPRGAVYDSDCAVVIEGFDHTCPWTGTAIGKKNMTAFQAFIALVFTCLMMNIILLTSS